jgi:hypothetical protein
MALVDARLARIACNELFTTPRPFLEETTKRWRWVAKPHIEYALLSVMFEFLYSGAFEVLDRTQSTRDFVVSPGGSLTGSMSAEDEEFIKEVQYERDMRSDMGRMRRQLNEYCDLQLRVEGRVFHAHKFILARCMPFRV